MYIDTHITNNFFVEYKVGDGDIVEIPKINTYLKDEGFVDVESHKCIFKTMGNERDVAYCQYNSYDVMAFSYKGKVFAKPFKQNFAWLYLNVVNFVESGLEAKLKAAYRRKLDMFVRKTTSGRPNSRKFMEVQLLKNGDFLHQSVRRVAYLNYIYSLQYGVPNENVEDQDLQINKFHYMSQSIQMNGDTLIFKSYRNKYELAFDTMENRIRTLKFIGQYSDYTFSNYILPMYFDESTKTFYHYKNGDTDIVADEMFSIKRAADLLF